METIEHVAKLVAVVFVVSLVACIVGGWVLTLTDHWDKEELQDGEKPLDLTGWRR
jgi:type III secretory pathway component EscS